MAIKRTLGISPSGIGSSLILESDQIGHAGISRLTAGQGSLYGDGAVTSIVIGGGAAQTTLALGGGASYTGATIGKAGVTDVMAGACRVAGVLQADGGVERSSAGAASLYTDANTTSIVIGGGAAQTAMTLGKAGQAATFLGDLVVTGNMTISGTASKNFVNNAAYSDNHLLLNDGYVTNSAQTGGLVVNYLPTATADSVAAGGFTAGIAATSNPTVATTGAATFAPGDILLIAGSNNVANDVLVECLTHAANVLTVRGVGTTATVEDFTNNQFVTDSVVAGSITKVGVSIIRSGATGAWETGFGNTSPVSFSPLSVGGTPTWALALAAGAVSGGNNPVLSSGDVFQGIDGTFGGAMAIRGGASTGAANAGGALTLTGGAPGVTGAGGNLTLLSGAGGTTSGNSGSIVISTGSVTSGTSGAISVSVGASSGVFTGGALALSAGDGGLSGNGGAVTIIGGAMGASGAVGGAVTITGGSGAGGTGVGGAVNLTGGTSSGVLTGGAINLTGGSGGNTSPGGAITIVSGAGGATSGDAGDVTVDSGAFIGGTAGAINIGPNNALIINIATSNSAQTANIATGVTNPNVVHIADGAVANTVTIGSTSGAATTTIQSGTGGLSLGANGSSYLLNGGTVSLATTAQTIIEAINESTNTVTLNNNTGAVIVAGSIVGPTTTAANIQKAAATADNLASRVCGITLAAIANGSSGQIVMPGEIATVNLVTGLTFVNGDPVFMSLTTGKATTVQPTTAGNVVQHIGYVSDDALYAGSGTAEVIFFIGARTTV